MSRRMLNCTFGIKVKVPWAAIDAEMYNPALWSQDKVAKEVDSVQPLMKKVREHNIILVPS